MARLSTLRRFVRALLFVGAAGWLPTAAEAQSAPLQLFDGTLRIAGEASVAISAKDDDAFFNYTDYERNALRMLRLSATALWQPTAPFAIVGEIRSEDFDGVSAAALYVRIRPWRTRPFDIQAGRIPPVFGAYGRQAYGSSRLLIGYPLGYQYLTSLRADAVPADGSDLLRMRGRGWRSSFPIGDQTATPGVPLISAFRWDTGVQVRLGHPRTDLAVAVTQGTLANPRLTDDNDRPQLSGRFGLHVTPGLHLGASAARGRFLSDDLPASVRQRGTQTTLGVDAEFSTGKLLVRGESIWTRWSLSYLNEPPEGPWVKAWTGYVEGRYRFTPRFYVAARADSLLFSEITPPSATILTDTWDADVQRVEAGGGYSLFRQLVLRATVQHNIRDGGRVTSRTYVASEVTWWF